MPNWCENTVRIKGTKEDIEKLQDWMGNMDFERILPTPYELQCGPVGQTACNIFVKLDEKDKSCHAITGVCINGSVSDMIRARYSPDGICMTKAIIDGYTPCPKCLPLGTYGKQKGTKAQYLDKTIEESIQLFHKYGTDNWYDWHNTHWGTKWNCNDINVDWGATFVHFHFLTAWAPP